MLNDKSSNMVEKLALLRIRMKHVGVSAYVISSNDPHLSEYLSAYWKQREWLSGFTGSVGTLVVLREKAALWTDSRYYLQAEKQLYGTGIDLIRMSDKGAISIPEYLLNELEANSIVGLNANLFPAFSIKDWQQLLDDGKLTLEVDVDLVGNIWIDRPILSQNSPYIYDIKFAGLSFSEKLKSIRKSMEQLGVDVFPVTALDEVAWLFNIRGNDVPFNPFCMSYCIVEKEKALLFLDKENISEETQSYFIAQNIDVVEYNEFQSYLAQIKGKAVLLDSEKVNYMIFQTIAERNNIIQHPSPIALLKTRKNEIEIAGIKQAMLKDAVALVKWNRWLEHCMQNGVKLTELSVSEKLHECRSVQADFMGGSFATIAAYGANGAIVHYSATEETDAVLKQEGFLLLDSGGQYLHGTTDITRTIALGDLSKQQKKDFTLVLKGHIALASAKFPYGTRGCQLDVLARQFLWQYGQNYGHGTGHGVGYFLGVHEGPISIRPDLNPTILASGMVLSNEPGVYRENEYGIRTENLLLIIENEITSFGNFLSFEVLTLFPIDLSAIDFSLLEGNELTWLNNYHKKVYTFVSPLLSNEEKKWLKEKCKKVK